MSVIHVTLSAYRFCSKQSKKIKWRTVRVQAKANLLTYIRIWNHIIGEHYINIKIKEPFFEYYEIYVWSERQIYRKALRDLIDLITSRYIFLTRVRYLLMHFNVCLACEIGILEPIVSRNVLYRCTDRLSVDVQLSCQFLWSCHRL